MSTSAEIQVAAYPVYTKTSSENVLGGLCRLTILSVLSQWPLLQYSKPEQKCLQTARKLKLLNSEAIPTLLQFKTQALNSTEENCIGDYRVIWYRSIPSVCSRIRRNGFSYKC